MSKRYGRTLSAVIPAALVVLGASVAVAGGPNLKYAKPLKLPGLAREELVAVPLDSGVYEVTRAGFPDMRVYDASNKEVVFVVRKAVSKRDETTRETWTPRHKPSAKPLDDGALEVTVQLDRDEPVPEGVRLVSPLQNFEHRVQVGFSTDGNAWQPLVNDGLIFDYAKYIDVRTDALQWKSNAEGIAPWRFLRITINDVTKEQESQLIELTRRLRGREHAEATERLLVDRRPFRIDRLEFSRDVTRQRALGDRQADYPLSDPDTSEDVTAKVTYLTVNSRREPITSLSFVTESRNFSRALRVEAEHEGSGVNSWQALASGNISHVDIRNLDRTHLTISIPESRYSRYRVIVENRDSPPLAITKVSASGPIYEMVFLADPKAEYRLAYGGASIDSPNYDTLALTESLSAGFVPLAAELGEQSVLAEDVVAGEPLLNRLINDVRLLTAAIAILVVVLGVVLYQATARVKRQLG